jgi:hypothetical protein
MAPIDSAAPVVLPLMTPRWLRQVADVVSEGQQVEAGREWQRRLYHALTSVNEVPFRLVHDWLAHEASVILPYAGVRSEDRTDGVQRAVQELHRAALAGETIPADTWRNALYSALLQIYTDAYAYTEAFEVASAAARAFARSRGWSEADAAAYGATYARQSTDANVRTYAEANAVAVAAALASAFANEDPEAYADAHPEALVRACLADGQDELHGQEICNRLAAGLVEAVQRLNGST